MARTSRKGGSARPNRFAAVREKLAGFLSLPRLEAWSTNLRSVFINGLFLVMMLVILPVVIAQFRRNQVIIEPIAVPEIMAAQGLGPEVVASRLWDGLHDVIRDAGTAKASVVALPETRKVEFSFPDSGFSFESLIYHLRRLFNAYDTRIAGEFVCGSSDCDRAGLRLRLRVVREKVDVVDLQPMGDIAERRYLRDAAAGVMGILDPFVAIAAASQTEPGRALILARKLIRSRHPDAKWAHNLIGNIRARQGDLPGAIAEYREALALDGGFDIAHVNLGDALRSSGDLVGARSAYESVRSRDENSVGAITGIAELAVAAGDLDAAVAEFETAAALDPLDPRHLARAGGALAQAGRVEEGERLLRRALEVDPGYPPAFALLAANQLVREDYAAAERTYRDAAEYAPDDATAQFAYGRILAILKRWEDAIVRFRRAAALSPDDADPLLQEAICLQRLGRHGEALSVLDAASARAPESGPVFLARGDSLRDTGRKAEAVAAYRRFIELDPESVMRPVAERFIELLSQ